MGTVHSGGMLWPGWHAAVSAPEWVSWAYPPKASRAYRSRTRRTMYSLGMLGSWREKMFFRPTSLPTAHGTDEEAWVEPGDTAMGEGCSCEQSPEPFR